MKKILWKHYDADADAKKGGGGDDKTETLTVEKFMTELTNIKAALQKNFDKKAEEQEKNWEEKMAAAEVTITELKAKIEKGTVDVADLAKMKEDMAITVKAFDQLQTRIKADQLRSYNGGQGGQGGEDRSFEGQIIKAITEKKADIVSSKIVGKSITDQGMVLKAPQTMTVIGNVNTGVVPNTYRPGIIPQPYELIHLRNLVAVTPSETDSYHFFRHASTGEGAITFQGNENGTKAQFDEDLVEITVNLDYLAGFLKISKKMLRNFAGLQGMLTRWLPEKYYQAEDTKGYQVIIAQATGVQDTSGTDMISVIIRTIGKQKKARYNVNGIVVDGEVWAKILTYKAVTSGEFTQPIGVVTIAPDGTLMICGIPVYTASWVGGDQAIIADWRWFEIIQSEALQLGFFEQDGTNIQQNLITVRIEASVGFAMLDPKAFVVASLASVS